MDTNLTSPMEFLRGHAEQTDPRLAFHATDGAGLRKWRTTLRARLRRLLGLDLMEEWVCDPAPQADEPESMEGYTRRRVTIETAPGFRVPFFELRPAGKGPFPVVLAMHGHGYGKRDVCGMARTKAEAERQEELGNRYGVEAVRRGYLVLAPDKRAFGELAEQRDLADGRLSSCEWHNMSAILLGMTQIGLHVWDNARLLDYALSHEDCSESRIASIGVSGGGQTTLWLAALDERVHVAVVSGHLGSFARSILQTDGCSCNSVPGLLHWCEKGEVGGLIAPRPLLVESGSDDPAYTRESQLEAYQTTCKVYQVAGAADRLDIDLYEGPHRWSGNKAWDWLARWL